jgi:tetratricopeptide (TPR) repeat protein
VPLLEETLAKRKAKLGPDHPHTLNCMDHLAYCYWLVRRLDKSVPLFEELLTRREKKHGRGHPETLKTLANLGVNYKDAGRPAEAIPLLEEAYRATRKHPTLRWVGQPLLDAYQKTGKAAEAVELLDEQLADARRQLPGDSPQLAGVLAKNGLAVLEMRKFVEAEPLLRESLAIREKVQPDAWNTFNTLSMLGGALLGQRKYAEAEPLLLAGYEGMKARETTIPRSGGGELRIPEGLDRLIELYTATGKPEEVTKWRAERAKYPDVAPPPREKK